MRTLHEDKPIDTTTQIFQASNIVDNFYSKSVILERELSLAGVQAAVGNNYGNLQFAFNNFQIILNKTCQQQKVSAKPKWQATLSGMFSTASSSKLMSIA